MYELVVGLLDTCYLTVVGSIFNIFEPSHRAYPFDSPSGIPYSPTISFCSHLWLMLLMLSRIVRAFLIEEQKIVKKVALLSMMAIHDMADIYAF